MSRYKGRALGVFWSLVSPLLMLLVYTFVFWHGLAFSIWNLKNRDHIRLWVSAFLWPEFVQFLGRGNGALPSLILSQPNLVKKVVFPLEILPLVNVLDAAASLCFSFCAPLFRTDLCPRRSALVVLLSASVPGADPC